MQVKHAKVENMQAVIAKPMIAWPCVYQGIFSLEIAICIISSSSSLAWIPRLPFGLQCVRQPFEPLEQTFTLNCRGFEDGPLPILDIV